MKPSIKSPNLESIKLEFLCVLLTLFIMLLNDVEISNSNCIRKAIKDDMCDGKYESSSRTALFIFYLSKWEFSHA